MKEYICIDGFEIFLVVLQLHYDNLHILLVVYTTKMTKILLFSIELY